MNTFTRGELFSGNVKFQINNEDPETQRDYIRDALEQRLELAKRYAREKSSMGRMIEIEKLLKLNKLQLKIIYDYEGILEGFSYNNYISDIDKHILDIQTILERLDTSLDVKTPDEN